MSDQKPTEAAEIEKPRGRRITMGEAREMALQMSAAVDERLRRDAEAEAERNKCWSCEEKDEIIRTIQARNAELQADVKRMGEALKYVAPTGYHLGLSIVWCEEDEPVSARMAMEALSSISPQSRALVDSPMQE